MSSKADLKTTKPSHKAAQGLAEDIPKRDTAGQIDIGTAVGRCEMTRGLESLVTAINEEKLPEWRQVQLFFCVVQVLRFYCGFTQGGLV